MVVQAFFSVKKPRDISERCIWEGITERDLSNYGLTSLFSYCARF